MKKHNFQTTEPILGSDTANEKYFNGISRKNTEVELKNMHHDKNNDF